MMFLPLLFEYVTNLLIPIFREQADQMDQGCYRYLIKISLLQTNQAVNLIQMRNRFWEKHESNRFTLYQLLGHAFVANSTQSRDPRDRVISLRGLACK